MDAAELLKPEPNKLSELRTKDSIIGTLVNDIVVYALKEDYRRAAQASAYLLIALAKQSAQKPYKLLQIAK